MTRHSNGKFGRFQKQAGRYAGDPARAEGLLSKAVRIALANREALARVWDDLMILFRLIGCWFRGEYRRVPLKTILSALAAIIYLVTPFDAIPDFIPVAGLLDDAAVIAFVINSIRRDLEEFRGWEKGIASS